MAGTTVIDQLIVKLGLDPRDFTKGERQAAAETVKLETQVKKSSDNMGRSVLGFTGKLLGIATVAIAVKKGLSYISDLSRDIRQLGIDSGNFNIAAGELRNFGNVAEMMGGKAEDVTKTVGGLNKAVYDLAYNGQISDSLIMLGRLGVQFQDTAGNMRDFKSIALDAQGAVQKAMGQGTSRASAYQMLMQAGFDPGLANAMLEGTLGTQLARQGQRRQVSGADVKLATDLEKSAANRDQGIQAATLSSEIVRTGIRGTTAANNSLAAGADKAGNYDTGKAASDVAEAFTSAGSAIKKFVLGLEQTADRLTAGNMPRGRAAYENAINAAADKYGIDREVLHGIARTESGYNPAAEAVNPKTGQTTGRGIMQLNPKFFKNAGKNPIDDIDVAAKHFSGLLDKFEGNEQERYVHALRAYNAGETNYRNGTNIGPQNQAYAGKVLSSTTMPLVSPNAQSAAGGNRTEITFENVTVQTNGKDGDRIATDFVDGTRRKMMTAQADAGVQ